MYKTFYGFERNAFDITPDPFFYFPTSRHNEALANLAYGIQRRRGFVVVTGEVGTGKTLLVRCLLDLLNRVHIAFAYVFNPRLSAREFLQHVACDLRIATDARNKTELLQDLHMFLIERYRAGSTTVLVIDEAQLLSWDLLEEIRLLGNLETAQEKLLQIIFVGQPELDRKVDSPRLRQLKQRIGLRCHLEPLRQEEARNYIQRRLVLAGYRGDVDLFPEPIVTAIYQHSRGIPRLINAICENALICGCAKRARTINEEIVQEVASDLHLERRPKANPVASSMFMHDRDEIAKHSDEVLAREDEHSSRDEDAAPAAWEKA